MPQADHKQVAEAVLDVLDEHSFIGASMYCLTTAQRQALLNKLIKALERL
jgi:hypothetical protein